MSINFTGDVTFKNKLFTLMGLNEASGKTSNTPYVLSWANTANSGWSFGYIQYDLSTGNADGNDLFKDILRNAVDSAGNYIIDDGDPTTGRLDDKLVAALCNQAKTKNGQGLSSAEQSLISSALSSTYGMREINGNVDGALQKLIDFADKVKVAASPSDQAFLQSDLARLFLCDYGNEFGVNGTGWLNFVQGSSFNGYQKNGALGVDDLLGGYFRTAEAQKDQGGYLGANTVLKRFAAVVQVAGGYTPTDLDEAKGVLRAYTYLYVPHEDQILATNARVQNLNAFRDAVCKPAESLVFADLESRGISVTETYDDILVGDDTGNITASGEYQLNGRDGNDVILGEGGNDTLDGGAGQDTLIGGIGTDTLIGGAGDDTLYGNDNAGGDILDGGVGNDTYYADDGDTIRDSDGQGTIYLNGKQLSFATRKKGEILYKDAAGNTYLQIGNTLQINDPLVIENFTAGDLGITLDEYSPPSPGSNPLQEAFGKAEQTKSPIVLDLNGNGIATQDVSNGTFFDYDGNGFAERTGWATSGDGILVRDLNGNGKIDDGTELFGDRTQLKNGQTAANGFAALADLDSNGDSKLDSQDSAWAELNIWQDRNSDGIANAGELKTLSDLGIQSIATGYTTSISTDANGNTHQQQGSYTKTDGSTALAEDVWFKADQSSTRNLNLLAISEVIHNMPEIQGKGNVASLRQVLAQQAANGSSTLMNLIDQFAAEADPVARNALTTRIIYEWTGVTDKDPMSRAATKIYNNPIGDARKLYAMEALLGEGYVGTWCWGEQDPNPHGPASAVLLKAYDEFANGIAAQLIQQTRLKELYGAISYTWDATSQTLHGDLSSTLPLITAKLEANREQGKSALAEFITNLTYTNKISEFDTRAFQEALVAYGQDVVSVANLAWRGMIATQGNDQLTGDGSDEVIAGWGGNDLIYGGGGNDSLLGGEGNDALYGQDGNDTLDGGLGNDLLDGGAGNDTYLFGRTSGQDTILSQDNTANKRDVLKFDAGVLPTDIDLIRNIDDLILTIRDTGNRMTVAGYFVNDGVSQSSLQAIEFNDGTAWDFAAVKAMLPSLGTEGNDQIRGYNTAEVINGLVGNDVIEGRGGDDVISGGAGNDTLFGQEGNDTLDGGIGNDALQGGAGNDTYLFNQGGGQDTIHDIDSTAGNVDTVRFGAGIAVSDIAFSRSGNDLVLGINGTSDQLIIQSWGSGNAYRIERVEFADGSAWDAAYIQSRISALPIVGTNGNDYLNGWADSNDTLQSMGGNDTLIGSNGNDTLDGGTGNDTLRGYTGNDTYLFNLGGGQDIISEYDYTADNVDTIRFGAGIAASDIAFSRSGNDLALGINGTSDRLSIPSWGAGNAYRIERVEFADGTAWDTAYIQSRISALPIVGTNGNDSLNSWSGSIGDQLQGMEGNDTLIGSTGNDMLDGGTGNDNLYGGTGNDTYLFNLGGGRDTIYDNDSTAGNVDTIRFGVGIATGDINFSRSGNDLVLGINGTSDRLSIQSWGAGSAYRIERVEFADGAAWDTAYIQSRISALPIVGTNGNDYLNSWSGSIGDQLQGIEGNDTLIGSTGNDMLDGGTGNDTLQGGTGNDTYLFNLGGGRDTIYDNDSTAGNVDTIRFGAGIATGDISFSRSGNDLMLSINGTTDQLKVQNWGYGDAYRIEQVAFVDGTIWDSAYLQAQTAALLGQTILGTEGTDYLQSWVSENATLQGMGGNDTLIGNNGNDTLDGGSGNDILQGGAGNDTYLFNLGGGQDVISEYDSSAGNVDTIRFGVGIAASDISFARNGYDLVLGIGTTDQLKIQSWGYRDAYRIERVEFADGASWDAAYLQEQVSALPIVGTTGNDYLFGDSGNNTLDGGTGNDTLQGGAGNDTYLFNLGGGQDTIYETDSTAGNVDTIRFGAGIAAGDITFSYSGNDLVLAINGTNDQVKIQNWGYSDAYRIERVQFADGASWDAAYLQTQVSAIPIVGTTGNDSLYGDSWNNTLDGGAGNDTLHGGAGNDTYLFNLGDGQDTIYEADSTAGNVDTLRFGAGIAASNIIFTYSGNDLLLSIKGATDQVILQNWNYGDAYRIERVAFVDGTVWGAAYLQAQALGKLIVGTTGNDYLSGDIGNDTLDGGIGNDTLQGGAGNDTYLFNLGDGQDIIYDGDSTTGNVDTVRFDAGIAASDIAFSHSGNDLVLSINGTDDRLTIQHWGYGDYNHIERVEFADGMSWNAAYLQAQFTAAPIVGTTGNDYLSGDAGSNTLDGGAGNDYLYGGTGNDTYLFNLGGGQDTISDYDSTTGNVDTIRFGTGIVAGDITFNRSGNDLVLTINGTTDQLKIQNWGYRDYYQIERVEFADGTSWDAAYLQTNIPAPTVVGTAGDDTLSLWVNDSGTFFQGMEGNDVLIGNSGNDILDGGVGNDTLQGGAGNDTYLFNLGDGQDTIYDGDSTAGNMDTIRFGAGIAAGDIRFSGGYGGVLVLGINGTTDQLKIQSWGYGDYYHIEQVAFADGTSWNEAYLQEQFTAAPIVGTVGNDYLTGNSGNNTLDGGAGNDYLYGGTGNDTYLIHLGGGQDTISEYDYTAGNVDTIRFGIGIAASDVTFSRSGNNLVLSISGTTDQLTIKDWGNGDAYHIERIEFADGTVWGTADLPSQLSGLPLIGTSGNDYLYGDAGNDTLDGGAGNDTLVGGTGNDTYLFNLGGGQDRISEYDSTPGNVDTVRLGKGIMAEDITFSRNGYDLVLGIDGTSEQLTIQNWGYGDYYHIERVQFADGTSWDAAYLQAQDSAIPIVGTIDNDYLSGDAGNNTLDGGAGNDYLNGGRGNDTYLFNLGGGQDTIYDYDSTAGNMDTIRFGAGIAEGDITLTRSGNDLVLGINGTAEQLTIQKWRHGDAYHIERVQFADGTVWDAAFLSVTPISGTEEADSLQAWAGENATLQGLGGGDALYGNDGNDILDGGAGNDYLSGSTGNDTYLFNLGGGQDNIYDGDSTAGNVDTIRFGAGIAASDITFTRSGNALVLNINGTADQLTIQSWRYGDAYHIERVEFADGTVWDAAFLSVTPISGTEEADSLQAWAGENVTLQ
ncbi:MAG: hypothetical protein M0Q44_09510, partial [Methylobacter sp.]|nr:hypothetical protein [Methylobacter sp.]